jgi:MULE transposase domain/SWIM zinc finger
MDTDLFGDITTVSAALQSWEPENLVLEAEDGNPVDILEFMEGGTVATDSIAYLAPNNDWSKPSCPHARAKLVAHINSACKNSGFSMVVKEWDPHTNFGGKCRNIPVGGKLRLYCSRGIPYRGDKTVDGDIDKKKKTQTSRPTCDEAACPFKFNLFWFENKKRWGLIANGGHRMHHGHFCDNAVHVKCTTTNLLTEDDMDLANDLFECNQTPAEVDQLLHLRSDISLTPNQVKYLRQKHLKNKQQDNGPTTPASRFLSWLESNENISYILLFDKGQSDMVHVRQPGRLERERFERERSEQEEVTFHCVERQSGNEVVARDVGISVASSANVEDHPVAYVSTIRRSMDIPDTNQVLLAAVWTSDPQRRLYTLFPEVTAADVTEQTNKEKRPLLLLGGLTSDNESFTFCQAFLPSQQKWVFDWFFSTAVPALFSQETLHRTTLMLTDGDSKEYGAFMDAADRFFPNSRHRLCYWHLMDRGLKNTRIYQHASSLDVNGTNYFNGMINWVKSWFHTLETMDEYADSRRRLFEWLATDEIQSILGATIIDTFIRFIVVQLDPYQMRWLNASFLHIRTLDRKSTQFLEAENSVLKTQEGGPRPNHGLDLAAASIDKQGNRRWHHKDQRFARAVDRKSIQHQEIHSNCKVNMYCLENLLVQTVQGKNYSVVRESVTSFLVKRSDALAPISVSILRVDPTKPDFEHFIVPQYTRTRRVSIIDGKYVKCSCGLFSRCGYPCRHIYAVLKRSPRTQDVIPRYHVFYAHLFNRNEALTNYNKQAFTKEVPGPPLADIDIVTIELIPVCTNIPESFQNSVPGRLLLSSKCFQFHNCVVIESADTTMTMPGPTTGNVRFQQQIHLSQASLFDNSFGNGPTVVNDVDDVPDIGINSNLASGEIAVSSVDEEGIKNCIYSYNNEMENLDRYKNHDDLFNSLMPYYRETCKLGEGRPWMRERIARRFMYVFEISDTEVNEQLARMNPHRCQGEAQVVSSRPEENGPKRASRKRPMHSPAKKSRKHRK